MKILNMPTMGNSMNSFEMPGSIVKAVCQVKAGLETAIKHDCKNNHGGYTYASAEAIYAALSKRMGQAGLAAFSMQDREPEVEKFNHNGKTVVFVTFHSRMILATENDTFDAGTRSLRIQYTGPQTYQAAQSYLEKQFYKSLFSLATGDRDLDALPQADTLEDQIEATGTGAKRKRKSSSQAKKDGDDKKFNSLVAEIRAANSTDELAMIWQREVRDGADWGDFAEGWKNLLKEEYDYALKDASAQMGNLV